MVDKKKIKKLKKKDFLRTNLILESEPRGTLKRNISMLA
jgi:uncharacterized protein YqgQ